MEFPAKRDYASHSRFALRDPKGYVLHVERALRQGKRPQEANYFEDIYVRALGDLKKKGGAGMVSVSSETGIR